MSLSITTGAAATPADDRRLLLDAARKPAETVLARKVWLKEKSVRTSGDWAFVLAELQGADGRPIDYHGTPKAQQAEAGFLSKDYVALLRRQDGKWRVVKDAIGPTDVVWEGWSQEFGAPADLFKL